MKQPRPKLVSKRSERGQAMTEYLIIVSVFSVFLLGTVGVFLLGVSNYYLNIVKVVCLPFP